MLLVTGITGHTGRHFLQCLIKNNYRGKIRCAVRKTSNIKALKNNELDIEIATGDLNDPSFIDQIMEGVNTVLHIYNIHHSLTIVQAAIDHNVQRAILVHTTGIYSQYKSASGEYMRIESEVIKKAKNKLVLTILRPSMIYGDMCDHNMSKFIKMIDKIKIFPLINSGRSLIQPVNARDLANAYYDVLLNSEATANKQYDLTGDKPLSIKEALTLISIKLNKKVIFISVPLKLSVFAAYILKLITIGKVDIIEKVLRMGEDRAYNHEMAQKDFGFTPMPFAKGIAIEINEYRQK
jgi:uncharacterized protein YbjT (DUF2867 family)